MPSMIALNATAENGPLSSAADDSLTQHLTLSAVTLMTTTFLCVIKYSVYFLSRRRRNKVKACSPETNDRGDRHTATGRLLSYQSDLCCDALTCAAMTAMGLYSLHSTSLLQRPFTGEDAFLACRPCLHVTLGHLCYRLIHVTLGGETRPRLKITQLYVMAAMATYISILATWEDAIVGVVGMFCQLPTFMATLEKISRHSLGGTLRCVSFLRLTSDAMFSLVLPLVYLCLAIRRESPFGMSYFSLTVFMTSVPYFGIIRLLILLYRVVVSTSFEGVLVRKNNRPCYYVMLPSVDRLGKIHLSSTLIQNNVSEKIKEQVVLAL